MNAEHQYHTLYLWQYILDESNLCVYVILGKEYWFSFIVLILSVLVIVCAGVHL